MFVAKTDSEQAQQMTIFLFKTKKPFENVDLLCAALGRMQQVSICLKSLFFFSTSKGSRFIFDRFDRFIFNAEKPFENVRHKGFPFVEVSFLLFELRATEL